MPEAPPAPTRFSAARDLAHARLSFRRFYGLLGRDRRGAPMPWNDRLELIDATLNACWRDGRHLSLVAPPGEGKSTYARLRLLWEVGRDPLLNAAIVSAVQSVARMNVSLCRAIVAEETADGRPGLYRRVFPEIVPDYEAMGGRDFRGWRLDEFYVRRGAAQAADPILVASPARTQAEARRLDLAVFDDVMTREVAASPAERTANIAAVVDTWLEGRLVDAAAGRRGRALLLQNCWNSQDLAHRLLSDPRITSLWLGVNETNEAFRIRLVNPPEAHPFLAAPGALRERRTGEPDVWEMPFPEAHGVWNKASLDREEAANPTTFARAFRNRAVSDDELMFPSWSRRTRTGATAAEVTRLGTDAAGRCVARPGLDRDRLLIAAGLDLSSRRRAGNWLTIAARMVEGQRVVLEQRFGAWSMRELAEVLREAYARLPWVILHVEDVGVQDQLAQTLRDDPASISYRHTLIGFTTGSSKRSEEIGLPGLDLLLGNGTWLWPEGELRAGAPDRAAWERFYSEIAVLPRIVKPGMTPDSVMAWWFADRALTRLGAGSGSPGTVGATPATNMASSLGGYSGEGSSGSMASSLEAY